MPDHAAARILGLALVLALVALVLSAPATAGGVPYTETQQAAYFPGQIPNATWEVTFSVTHYEGETSSVYTLGTTAYSGPGGVVKGNAPMDALASGSGYSGDAPIYEVRVCLYYPFVLAGGPPIACTAATFVGHTPESLWDGFYGGAKRRP